MLQRKLQCPWTKIKGNKKEDNSTFIVMTSKHNIGYLVLFSRSINTEFIDMIQISIDDIGVIILI